MICRNLLTQLMTSFTLPCAIAVMLALACIPQARAAGTDSFTVKIAEKQQALSDPTNTAVQHFLMWDLGADRVIARSMPFLELQNDSTSTSPITEFHLTIGDTLFHFDCAMLHSCAMLASSTPNIDLTSAVSAIAGKAGSTSGDQLDLTIGNGGLQPGQVLRFKISLAQDAGENLFAHPDFRTVLFDMNGKNVYNGNLIQDSTTDNAQLTAVFKLAGGGTLAAGPTPLADTSVPGVEGQYYNGIMRHYGIMEPVDTFAASGSVAVPEPGTIMLAAFGLVIGLMPIVRRQRRS
jgi:PEP-CTERM motif